MLIAAVSFWALATSVAYADIDPGDFYDDDIPGLSPLSGATGYFYDPEDTDDVINEWVYAGETFFAVVWSDPGTNVNLRLFAPSATTVHSGGQLAVSTYDAVYNGQILSYTAPASDFYYLDVHQLPGQVGHYTVRWSVDDGEDDEIPGTAQELGFEPSWYTSMLDPVIDSDDVLPITLHTGEQIGLTLYPEYSGSDVFAYLYPPGTSSIDDVGAVVASTDINSNSLTYTASASGTYYVNIHGDDSGGYDLTASLLGLPDKSLVPVAGANRVATAIEASKQAFAVGEADTVVMATSMNWPDALGGSALAGALDAPILLTPPAALPQQVADEIQRLGATKAIILGGEPAISKAVALALDALPGVTVERIGGTNRYDTANKVAARTISVLGTSYDGTAFVATGANFPDALGASPLAAARGWPIYLANPAWGSNATVAATMNNAGVDRAIVLGGPNVVSNAVATELKNRLGPTPERLYGADRYATALAIAQYGVDHAHLGWNKLAIATGQNFPDALAGGVLQGKSVSVMLLTPTDSLYSGVAAKLTANKPTIDEVRFLGGLPAVSQTVRTQVAVALR